MKSAESRNDKAVIKLLQDMWEARLMLQYSLEAKAERLLNEIIIPKMYPKDGQNTVELTFDELNKLELFLRCIKEKDYSGIESYLKRYQQEIEIKEEVYHTLIAE